MQKPALPPPYEELIRSILDRADQTVGPAGTQRAKASRLQYLEAAVLGGWDLRDIHEKLGKSPVHLKAVLDANPKRKELTPGNREWFGFASKQRSDAMQWDNLFPPGETEIVLPLPGEAKSATDKIEDYLARYNIAALDRFRAEQARDVEALASNALWRPRAGNDISQKQLRRDPEDKSRFQMLDPRTGDEWQRGPRIGQFLLDRYEWELADIYERSRAAGQYTAPDEMPKTRFVTLQEIAHRTPVSADDFDPDCLRVVISRDPQKIGEMSTGQRWCSCMQNDAGNFRYVASDIAAGTLVAYLVHRDDPQARWPLMRQLIKPFRNDNDETVLVPARVYGAEGKGNSRNSDALQQTVRGFVARQNAGKSGQFTMDHALYPDSQAIDVSFAVPWSHENSQKALRGYQAGAVAEWKIELERHMFLFKQGKKDAHGGDPLVAASDFRKKIRRVYAATDCEAGLPRLFYRNVYETQIGTPPDPRAVRQAADGSAELIGLNNGFHALMANNHAQWQAIRRKLSEAQRQELAHAAGLTLIHKEKAPADGPSAWVLELNQMPDIAERAKLFATIASCHLPGRDRIEAVAGVLRNGLLVADSFGKGRLLGDCVSLSSPRVDREQVLDDIMTATATMSRVEAIDTLASIAGVKSNPVKMLATSSLFCTIRDWLDAPVQPGQDPEEKTESMVHGCHAVLRHGQGNGIPREQQLALFMKVVDREPADEKKFMHYRAAIDCTKKEGRDSPIYAAAFDLLPNIVSSSMDFRELLNFRDEALYQACDDFHKDAFFKIGEIILRSIGKPGSGRDPEEAGHDFISRCSNFMPESEIRQDERYADQMRRATAIRDGAATMPARRPASRLKGVGSGMPDVAVFPEAIATAPKWSGKRAALSRKPNAQSQTLSI